MIFILLTVITSYIASILLYNLFHAIHDREIQIKVAFYMYKQINWLTDPTVLLYYTYKTLKVVLSVDHKFLLFPRCIVVKKK